MSSAIAFTIPEVPVAKGRARAMARAVKMGGVWKAIVQLVTPKETRDAEARLQAIARGVVGDRPPLDGPVRMTIVAVFPVPPSWPQAVRRAMMAGVVFHTSKPDADNLAKLVGDGLNAIAYQDDSQVAELIVRKRYGFPSRTEVAIAPLKSAVETPADKRRAPPPARVEPANVPTLL
jgi:Holliday junction resolvase RusA-like endonuclease